MKLWHFSRAPGVTHLTPCEKKEEKIYPDKETEENPNLCPPHTAKPRDFDRVPRVTNTTTPLPKEDPAEVPSAQKGKNPVKKIGKVVKKLRGESRKEKREKSDTQKEKNTRTPINKKSEKKAPRKQKITPEDTHQLKITQIWKKIEKKSEEKKIAKEVNEEEILTRKITADTRNPKEIDKIGERKLVTENPFKTNDKKKMLSGRLETKKKKNPEENEERKLMSREENLMKKFDKKNIAYEDNRIGKENDRKENPNQENLTVENLTKERNLNVTTDKNPSREKKKITVREKIEKIERDGKKENLPRKISREKISGKKILTNLTPRLASTTPSKVFKRGSEVKNPKTQNPMSKEKQNLILNYLEENRAGRSSTTKIANTNLFRPAVEPQLNHSLFSRSKQLDNPGKNRDQWGEERQTVPRQIDKTSNVAVSNWGRMECFGQDRPIRGKKTNQLGMGEPDNLSNCSQFVFVNDPEEA